MFKILALLLISKFSAADVMFRVRPHVVATPKSDVKLSQLVDAQGLSVEGQKQLNEIVILKAPDKGERQEIEQAELIGRLRPVVEIEKQRGTRVNVVIPKAVVIDTLKRDITEEVVTAELMQAWQPMCLECKLEIEAMSLPNIANIRDWSMKMKAELPKGSFSIPVTIIRENGSPAPAWISGRLLVKKKVPVAKRVLSAEERIQKDDVSWEYRDTSYAFDGIPSAEDMLGKKVRMGIRAGDPVWSSLLEKEKAIRRGEMVTVKSGDKNWEVSINVIAQQDAFVGDIINLKHPKTNAALVGQVTGQGEVVLR